MDVSILQIFSLHFRRLFRSRKDQDPVSFSIELKPETVPFEKKLLDDPAVYQLDSPLNEEREPERLDLLKASAAVVLTAVDGWLQLHLFPRSGAP